MRYVCAKKPFLTGIVLVLVTPFLSGCTVQLRSLSKAVASAAGGGLSGSGNSFSGVHTRQLNYAPYTQLEILSGASYPGLDFYQDGVGAAAHVNPSTVAANATDVYFISGTTLRKAAIATGEVTTLVGRAGVEGGMDWDGIGDAAAFNYPTGLALDGGNLYIADGGANTIRKMDLATGAVTTVAGKRGTAGSADGIGDAAEFYYPQDLVSDGLFLYVMDGYNYTIRKMDLSTFEVTTLAGSPGVRAVTDGTGSAANFAQFMGGLALIGTKLYVGDVAIRQVDTATGETGTVTGVFEYISGLTSDGTHLYYSAGNAGAGYGVVTRTDVNPSTLAATTSMIAGNGSTKGDADGVGAAARFNLPLGVSYAGGKIYVADKGNSKLRIVDVGSTAVTTLAGNSDYSNAGYQDGVGTAVKFGNLGTGLNTGVTPDGVYYYFTDTDNFVVRRLEIATGTVSLFAGTPGNSAVVDGFGGAASFSSLTGITTDGAYLYVSDTFSIRKIDLSTAEVTTLRTSVNWYPLALVNDGTSVFAITQGTMGVDQVDNTSGAYTRVVDAFNYPKSSALIGSTLYVVNQFDIESLDIGTGTVNVVAGAYASGGDDDGVGAAARFNGIDGLATDGTDLYVISGSKLRKVELATATVTTLRNYDNYRFSNLNYYGGYLYMMDPDHYGIYRVDLATLKLEWLAGGRGPYWNGFADGAGASALFSQWQGGLASDSNYLYTSDGGNHSVRKIDRSSGAVTTIAGSGGAGSADGTGSNASFNYPSGIALAGGMLYVVDSENQTVRSVDPATGATSTFAGAVDITGDQNGVGVGANFNYPSGIASDGSNLFVADSGNCTVRKIAISTATVSTIGGISGNCAVQDGPNGVATFGNPYSILYYGGLLYVLDSNTVRTLDPLTGSAATLAGSAGIYYPVNGAGSAASFGSLSSLTTDGTSLFLADESANAIFRMDLATSIVTTLFAPVANDAPGSLASAATAFAYPTAIHYTPQGLYLGTSQGIQRMY